MPPKPFIKLLNKSLKQNTLLHKGIQSLVAKVYPNPSAGVFYVAVKGQKSPLHIKVVDLDGRIILEENQTEFNGAQNHHFYIIQLTQGKSMIYKKVIVQ